MDQTRRQFLGSASAVAAAGLGVSSPFIGRAHAQDKKTVVLASMGPVTGNWDPTSHTTLGQLSFESFIFSHLTRCPMQEGKADEILARSGHELEADRSRTRSNSFCARA